MKKNILGFSFVELIVGVSISMILMISVGVLVSSGMKNITIQKQILDQSNDISNIFGDFNDILGSNFEILANTATSITVKTNYINGNGAYYILGENTSTGYCKNDASIETKELSVINFNPYEFGNLPGYSGSFLSHTISSGGQIITGKGTFGSNGAEGVNGTGMYLNNPSSLDAGGGKIFIADSGNNRILYLSGNQVYTLLDINDGILHPSSILYDNDELYILNSGKKELLLYHSKSQSTGNGLKITMKNTGILATVAKVEISLMPTTGTFNGSYDTGSYVFNGFSPGASDSSLSSGNKLTYSFSPSTSIQTGDEISIPTLTTTLGNGVYYIKTDFFNGGGSLLYTQYQTYEINGDDNIFTQNDNTLKSIFQWNGGEDYQKITANGAFFKLENLLSGDCTKIHKNSYNEIPCSGSTQKNYSDFEYQQTLSNFKIKDMNIMRNGNLLTLKIEYYKSFSCYNEKDSIIKTILIKKVIP